MATTGTRWQSISITPAEAPTVERCQTADGGDTYQLAFETAGLDVMLTPDELQELVSRAIVAQAVPPLVDLTD